MERIALSNQQSAFSRGTLLYARRPSGQEGTRNRLAWLVLIVCWMMPSAFGQTNQTAKTPKVLLEILHCAQTDRLQFLESAVKKDGILRVAWAHKIRYQPYVDEGFIVLFKSETEGDILVYSRESSKGKTEFYLDNNMGFVVGPRGLELIDPLWGLWTRANIARNVKRALGGPAYAIPVQRIMDPFPSVGCHSYEE
jgi:hypothetical protein